MTTEEECSRMQCVDKVRTLLAECLGPPNETAFFNFDRCLEDELATTLEVHPDKTISFQSFLDRISTYRPQYWGADPNAILQFAKYGWRCSDKFTVKCDICLSTVECSSLMQKPELWTLVSQKAHEKLCFWSGCPCPDRFTKIVINPKILKKKMVLSIYRTVKMGSDLPSVSKDVLSSMSITSETLDTLFEILDIQQTEETVSALALAVCGWLNCEVDGTMKCGYCQRQILFRNFHSIMDKSEKQSVSESQTSVFADCSQSAEGMEVCDDKPSGSEKVTINSNINNEHNLADGEVCLEQAKENFVSHSQDAVNSECDCTKANPSPVNESDSTVLPLSDSACDHEGVANATLGNNSDANIAVEAGKELSEGSGNVLLEAPCQLNDNVADKIEKSNEKSQLKQSEERCNEHLESQINESPEESKRMLNGGSLEERDIALENAAEVRCSKKRKLQDDEGEVDNENVCADDELNVKKLKSHAIEENGECEEAAEIADKKVKKESFNNCHNLVSERNVVCNSETLSDDKVCESNSEEPVRKTDGSCEGNEMSDGENVLLISEPYSLPKLTNSETNSDRATEDTPAIKLSDGENVLLISEPYSLAKLTNSETNSDSAAEDTPAIKLSEGENVLLISEPYSLATKLTNSETNSDSAAEDTPAIKLDTVSTKVNGDAPVPLSESIQVPKLNTLKDADTVSVSVTDNVKGCSNVSENDENKELKVNSNPSDCEMKLSEPLDVAGNVNHITPCSESGETSVSDENGVPKDSVVSAAVSLNCELSVPKSETTLRTSECEKKDTTLGNIEGNCDKIDNSNNSSLGPADDSNTAARESCEMETESSAAGDETSKRSGKRKLEDDSDQDNFQSKRNKHVADVTPKKQFHPVEEHRYWCIWKLRTKDRGIQKEGWRQVLDYLKLSPLTPAEQPTPDFYGEVKKVFSLLGDW